MFIFICSSIPKFKQKFCDFCTNFHEFSRTVKKIFLKVFMIFSYKNYFLKFLKISQSSANFQELLQFFKKLCIKFHNFFKGLKYVILKTCMELYKFVRRSRNCLKFRKFVQTFKNFSKEPTQSVLWPEKSFQSNPI